ncbi:MAG: insulinase family protein [Parachlamydiaceae bacterium]|nr:insulinase family protein [Parachlamydiaceae bacterium]
MTHKAPHDYVSGKNYKDFNITNVVEIPELQCSLIELVHQPSGAQIIYIPSEDPENLFCLSFQTLPDTSNGVAHILEHTVLCGSKKYPVKDPFFAMQRRSLNTFMNALTGSDFTCYPASSQVPKDFYNLLEVYLDAVFYPSLNELSFLQEGHRLEFSIPDDPTSPLEYKGIVFNEMKGAMSSPNTRLNEVLNRNLFPDLTYGINSGGDPKNIPELTHQQLKEFHEKFYHPSRCLFFFYGNMPLESHLEFITKNVLNDVKKVNPLPPLPLQKRFSAPKRIVDTYPIPDDETLEDKTLIAFSWLTCHILEQQELLALNIIEIILMDTDASPLKMALLKSGLCKQVGCYMDCEISEVPLVISLKGCNPEGVDELEKLIKNTLEQVVENGIPLNHVENAIHQLEFHNSEITGDQAPFGLSLFMRSGLLKQHGGDPESGLKIHTLFDELRKRNLEDPHYLTELIKKYLINNSHAVRVVLIPDKDLAAKELDEERAKLDSIQQKLTKAQAKEIIHKSSELLTLQKKEEEEENVNILPKVTLDDVPRASRIFPLSQEKIGNIEVFYHNCFTNEIIYADLVFDLPKIAEEDLPYVRLFSTLLNQMGCGGRPYADNLEYIQANTGGIGSFLTLNLQASDNHQFVPSLYIRGKALYRKTPKLFALIYDIATSVDFTDIPRLKEVLLKQYTGLQSSLSQNSLKYAINLSASSLDVPSKIANDWYGLEYFWKIKEIAQDFDAHAEFLVSKMQELQTKLLCLDHPHVIITCSAAMYDQIKGNQFYGLQTLLTKPSPKWNGDYNLAPPYTHARTIASPIAFTGMVLKTVCYNHPDAAALNIAAFLLDNLTLHTTIREQGGAYGGGAVSNAMSGNFYFYAYRDPNITTTLQAFEHSVHSLIKGKFSKADLEEAKLEMIQALDAPVAPGSRGDLAYGWMREGKTPEVRQAFRDRVIHLTRADVVEAVKKHLVSGLPKATTVVFAGRDLLEKENAKLLAQGKIPFSIESI